MKKVFLNGSTVQLTSEEVKALEAKGVKITVAKTENAEKAEKPAKPAKAAKAEKTGETVKFSFNDVNGKNWSGIIYAHDKSDRSFEIVGEDTRKISDAIKTIGVWNKFTKSWFVSKAKAAKDGHETLKSLLNATLNKYYGCKNAVK